jgi:hypothetical protein
MTRGVSAERGNCTAAAEDAMSPPVWVPARMFSSPGYAAKLKNVTRGDTFLQ